MAIVYKPHIFKPDIMVSLATYNQLMFGMLVNVRNLLACTVETQLLADIITCLSVGRVIMLGTLTNIKNAVHIVVCFRNTTLSILYILLNDIQIVWLCWVYDPFVIYNFF